ncbi:MAG TPA: hypothetical protein PLQ50_01965 [Candidatus Woesebacteria bacterium]|nr:hypothetical protein [Candidatus Woesebacteria bacterium]
MPKHNNRQQILEALDFQTNDLFDDTADLKFSLYLRAREMRQIVLYLEKLMLKKKVERDLFVKENKAIFDTLLQTFVDNSNFSIEGVKLDQESIQLSMQMAMDLRKVMPLINALFYGVAGLAS